MITVARVLHSVVILLLFDTVEVDDLKNDSVKLLLFCSNRKVIKFLLLLLGCLVI
jgi:hypothetical protein